MTVTELHIVIGKDGFVREQDGRQSLESVVSDIIGGQFEDAQKVLRIVPPAAAWPRTEKVEDITCAVAWQIHKRCDGDLEYLVFGSAAHCMVEQHVGIAHARTCLEVA